MTQRVSFPDEIEAPDALLARLADGRWHRGPELAAAIGISRAGVSARIARLRDSGMTIHSVTGRGYRLAEPLDLLDASAVRDALGAASTARLDQLILLQDTDSTNSRIAAFDDGATRACLAERQSAGRGRAGRAWVSPMAANLYLSLGCQLNPRGVPLGAISLAIGVAVADVLEEFGAPGVGLKWPNDLWINGDKIGGILVEARAEASTHTRLTAGLGLNLRMPAEAAGTIDQAWTRLIDHVPEMPSRSRVAGRCIDRVLAAIDTFAEAGLQPFHARWSALDATRDRPVALIEAGHTRYGIARGVAVDGSLILEAEGRYERIYSGDISLRLDTSGARDKTGQDGPEPSE